MASLRGTTTYLFALGTYQANRVRRNLVVDDRLFAGAFATVSLNADSPLIQCNTTAARYIVCEVLFKRVEIHGSQVLTTTGAHGHSL